MLGTFGKNTEEDPPEVSWMLCLGEDEGNPLIYRVREDVPAAFDRGQHTNLVKVIWRYGPDERGLPGEDDNEQMALFEDLLEERVERPALAVTALAVTGNGAREWHLYSREGGEALAVIDQLARQGPFPISTSEAPDPGWTAYREILDAVSENDSGGGLLN